MDNLRRFVLVFTAVIFLTLAVCGFILAKSYSDSSKNETVDLDVNANIYDPNKPEDAALGKFNENILFIIGDKENPSSELTFLLNVNSDTNEISFMFLPKDLKYATLSDRTVGKYGVIYNKKSISKIADIIASQFEISVDYYIHMPSDRFIEFIDLFIESDNPNTATTPDGELILDSTNAVEFELFVDLKYQSGKYNIDLNRNRKFFTGKEALQLIQFYKTQDNEYSPEMIKYYDGTDIKRIITAQAFFDAFISQKLIKTGNQAFADVFYSKLAPIIPLCETNLTELNIKQFGSIFTRINPLDICYYYMNGTDQYSDQYYLVYNETVTDIKNNTVLDGAITLKDKFGVN